MEYVLRPFSRRFLVTWRVSQCEIIQEIIAVKVFYYVALEETCFVTRVYTVFVNLIAIDRLTERLVYLVVKRTVEALFQFFYKVH